ncbi:MAG: phosphatase PAP2 family protein [Planctomycetota bacterium]|jgi:membrane-associated phospholipid phosphatase
MRRDKSDQAAEEAVSLAGDALSQPPTPAMASVWQQWWPFLLAVLLLVAAIPALAVDCPLSRWCIDSFPSYLRILVSIFEPFGQALGVLAVALAVCVLDRQRWWVLPRVLTCSFGAGLAANVVKMLVERTRPREFDFAGSVWTTFGGWLPLTGAGSGDQSFPSAHTATAAGLAMALAWLYPRFRMLFPVLVVLVAGHRLESGAHYLSDVLCGAALGIIVATGCLKTGRLPKWFDRLEQRWKASSESPPASV